MDKKDTTIHAPRAGAAARALVDERLRDAFEARSVRTIEEAAKALGQEGDEHFCPLCDDYFNTLQFVRHAAQCIKLHERKENGIIVIEQNPLARAKE